MRRFDLIKGKTIVLIVAGIFLLAGFSESLAQGCGSGWGRMSGWGRGGMCGSMVRCSPDSEMSWRGCFGLSGKLQTEICDEDAAAIDLIIEDAHRAIYEILEGYGIEDIEGCGCYGWDSSN